MTRRVVPLHLQSFLFGSFIANVFSYGSTRYTEQVGIGMDTEVCGVDDGMAAGVDDVTMSRAYQAARKMTVQQATRAAPPTAAHYETRRDK